MKENEGIRNLFFKSIILSKKQNVSYYLEPSKHSELNFYGKCLSGEKSKILIKKRGTLKSSTISSVNLNNNWNYHQISLGSLNGQKIELSLETSDDNSISAISSLYFQHDNNQNDKNVVFLLFDALRGDGLSLYGYKKQTTPFQKDLF